MKLQGHEKRNAAKMSHRVEVGEKVDKVTSNDLCRISGYSHPVHAGG